ncbi:MAG: SDR family oxidoreductase [Pseudomonadota bacterium]
MQRRPKTERRRPGRRVCRTKTRNLDDRPSSGDLQIGRHQAETFGTDFFSRISFRASTAGRMQGDGGTILNLASLTSCVGVPTATPYGSSKTGLLGMTRALTTEGASPGIRVNAIAPGHFRTDLTEVFYQDQAWCDAMLQKIPAGRFGDLDDLIGATVFLCSGASRYVTGQMLYIDGGFMASI